MERQPLYNAARGFAGVLIFTIAMIAILWPVTGWWGFLIALIPLRVALTFGNALERRDLEDYYDRRR
jgi:hypothetical protein